MFVEEIRWIVRVFNKRKSFSFRVLSIEHLISNVQWHDLEYRWWPVHFVSNYSFQSCSIHFGNEIRMTFFFFLLNIFELVRSDRSRCPALIRSDLEDSIPEALSCLGLVPHTIRGFLGRYSTVLPTGEAFHQCVACSPTVRKLIFNQ